jgi:hypothetical protein
MELAWFLAALGFGTLGLILAVMTFFNDRQMRKRSMIP